MTEKHWVFDTEVYSNCTLFLAQCVENGGWFEIFRSENGSESRLESFLKKSNTFVGFNSQNYDSLIVSAWCQNMSSEQIKVISDDIIQNESSPFAIRKKYKLKDKIKNHIDLIEVAPSFVGLKAYGARMFMDILQDLPFEPDSVLTERDEHELARYCTNDVRTTVELYKHLTKEIELRVELSMQYWLDLRSKSDSQISEQIFIKNLRLKKQEIPIPKTIRYEPPHYLGLSSKNQEILDRASNLEFQVDQASGHVKMPSELDIEVNSRTGSYKLGIGGLHSTHDKKVTHVAGKDHQIMEIDAASFYPTIMLNGGLYPSHIGQKFIDEYQRIYDQRIKAKMSGDKTVADTLKISLNGTFGKLASKHSILYAPDLMLSTTLTGQFTLLMLIEWLENEGSEIEILSANTDGIVLRFPNFRERNVRDCVTEYEELSRFSFEYTPYKCLAIKDVNNYIAVKPDQTIKAKGIYAPISLRKNPTAPICSEAVAKWLATGVDFETTIDQAPFHGFITARSVTGGAQQGGKYLGKVVRWYQSTESLAPILYEKNGNKVPKSEGARQCMNIKNWDEQPKDLDKAYYIRECIEIAHQLGAENFLDLNQIFASNFGVK